MMLDNRDRSTYQRDGCVTPAWRLPPALADVFLGPGKYSDIVAMVADVIGDNRRPENRMPRQ